MQRRILPALAAITLAALPLAGAHAAPPEMRPHHPGPDFGHMHRPLGAGLLVGVVLTDSQKEKIDEMLKQQHQPPHEQGDNPRQKLEELLESPTKPDSKTIKSLQEQISKEDAAHLNTDVNSALALRAILTPEQIEQAQQNREQAHDLGKKLHEITKIDLPHHGPEHHPDGPPPGPGPGPGPEQPPENP